jgi:FKBP-type peptidyl-prolyl cis-trans isomerase FklB
MLRAALLLCSCALARGSNAVGENFLAENMNKEGVITLASGMQYKVLRQGDGDSHPTVDSPCECHYEGRTAANYPDGEKFDSSYDRGDPTTFAPNQVIKGWTEAMPMMVQGDKWELYIPSDMAYGDGGRPPKIGGGDVLIFTIEIIKITGGKTPASRCDVKSLEGCNEREAKYVEGKKGLTKEQLLTELARLNELGGKKMAPAQELWRAGRVKLLTKLKLEL